LEVLFKKMGKLVAACPYNSFEAEKYGQNIFPPDHLDSGGIKSASNKIS